MHRSLASRADEQSAKILSIETSKYSHQLQQEGKRKKKDERPAYTIEIASVGRVAPSISDDDHLLVSQLADEEQAEERLRAAREQHLLLREGGDDASNVYKLCGRSEAADAERDALFAKSTNAFPGTSSIARACTLMRSTLHG